MEETLKEDMVRRASTTATTTAWHRISEQFYRENRKRWKRLSQWEKKDTDPEYAGFYSEERQMLEWCLTESLKDICTDLAKPVS